LSTTAKPHRPPPPPNRPLRLLAGLTPAQFMRRHWQRKPLVVRGALPGVLPLPRAQLFALAADDNVESRLIARRGRTGWTLKHGPFARSALPPLKRPRWTLLVQGVDLHDDAAHTLLRSFSFVPDARLDDLMISWASDGGGVGPHFDSYDVFLLQVHGRRRWRIGRTHDAELDPNAPLKILRRFVPEQELVLDAGDMLYLPPQWAHDGVAVGGDCMTYSIGMRAPQRGELAAELTARLADALDDTTLYRDSRQPATRQPAVIPAGLQTFAAAAVRSLVAEAGATERVLGELLSEPKPHVWFEHSRGPWRPGAVELDRRTRMLYDAHHVYINGDSMHARGKDAALLRRLADERGLDARAVRGASHTARALLREWFDAGWLQRRSR
jgi:50S ribosomal protein L16 3-hydroxylase